MTAVTEKMVEAGAAAMHSHGDEGKWADATNKDFWRDYSRECLSAALSASPAQPSVKALKWVCLSDGALAHTPFGAYRAQHNRTSFETSRYEMVIAGGELAKSWHDTIEAAKAAAQSDYEARIRSALLPQPAVPGEVKGWQPIETAPKDGTNVLAAFWLWNEPEKGRGMEVVSWDGEAWSSDAYPIYPPTHWMPLPASPEQGETDV